MPAPCALSVVLSRSRASAAVALPAVLGLRIVELMATHSSNTPGPRASKLAKVGCGEGLFGDENCFYQTWICCCCLSCIHRHDLMGYQCQCPPCHADDISAETSTTKSLNVVSSSCSKCGTLKNSGKQSCCARGGAWFKNCGNDGDAQFDHTWVDGIEACKDAMSSLNSPMQVELHNEGVIEDQMNSTEPQNFAQQQTQIYRSGSVLAYTVSTTSENSVGLARVVGFIHASLTVLYLQILSHSCYG